MIKKLILFIIGLISIIDLNAQSSWNFVGPYSNNNANGAEFETGQMTRIITNPYLAGNLFAVSQYAGLWQSNDNGGSWINIDMSSTGLDQSQAIAVKNSTEILVGNYHFSPILPFSNRVSSYNFTSQTWYHYPAFPNGSEFIINCVEVHPTNQSIIYAGTSKGLFRYNGTSWTLIVPNCYVQSIVFTNSTTCFISGSISSTAAPTYYPTGLSMVLFSSDPGNSLFAGFGPNITTPDPKSTTEICLGAGGLFALTVGFTGATENRCLHKITLIGSTFSVTLLHNWVDYLGGFRTPIIYDSYNNWVWLGSRQLQCYDLTNSLFYSGIKAFYHSSNGNIHDDMHGFCINVNNELFVTHDGGIVKGNLGALTIPTDIYFDRKNYGLNVSLINGFSGSEIHPNLFAIGCQDIVNTDIYDASIQKNLYTHTTWENDGAFIDKYDDNLMLLDASSYDKNVISSFNKGVTVSGATSLYLTNSFPPFSADLSSPDNSAGFDFGSQRTIQDPYRPGRIFEVGRRSWAGFYQYDLVNKVFALKNVFDPFIVSGLNWQQYVIDLSFSPQTKNSLYVITSNRPYVSSSNPSINDNSPSNVIKFIGPDIDNSWHNHDNMWHGIPWTYTANDYPLYQDITPNYSNFSSIGGTGVNIAPNDVGKVSFKKIETSPWNKDMVYVACNINVQGSTTNAGVKVLKYNGSTWSDYSTGIPVDETVNTMEMDYFSNDALYLSTELHTYYRDATMSSWIPFTTGLPGSFSTQMEINYHENTVRLGTYGRGIWKSQLQCPSASNISLTGTIAPNIYEAITISDNGITAMVTSPTALRGTKSVTLNPGFIATGTTTPNTYFYAFIHGCSSPGSSFRSQDQTNYVDWYTEKIIEEDELIVYPNPAKDIFNIEFSMEENKTGKIVISNLLGQVIKTIEISSSENKIAVDLNSYQNGMYLINLYSEEKLIKTQKVILSH